MPNRTSPAGGSRTPAPFAPAACLDQATLSPRPAASLLRGPSLALHAPKRSGRFEEAPETREVPGAFSAMVERVLSHPHSAYLATVPEKLRDATAALIVLTDPEGHAGRSLMDKARKQGWAACVRDHGEALVDRRQGYGLGPLDGLLYRGHMTAREYWTASTVFALWRDHRHPSLSARESLRKPGEPVAFGGGYTDWHVKTLDLSHPDARAKVLAETYSLTDLDASQHAASLGAAAAQWTTSPERFMYTVPFFLKGTFPAFGLQPLTSHLTPWSITGRDGAVLPLFSLSIFQHDLNFFFSRPLTAVPRLGTDPVRVLQQQVLSDTRAAGISHGFPWSDRDKHQHADFLPTGEAGFAWHDLGHLSVASIDPPNARKTLVRLHQELSAHCKELKLPETIGCFPFRKLFVARLFGLTDQSSTNFNLTPQEALQEHTRNIVGEPLEELLLNTNAAKSANVSANFVAKLPHSQVFYTGNAATIHGQARRIAYATKWQEAASLSQMVSTWQHFAGLQVAHSNQWLGQQGYAVEATLQEGRPFRALAILHRPYSAPPTHAHMSNGLVALLYSEGQSTERSFTVSAPPPTALQVSPSDMVANYWRRARAQPGA